MDKLNILAIDFNSLFARNWHASGGAERGEAYQRTVQWVQQARGSHDRVALCCDSGQKSFRVALWPEYKANRPPVNEAYREQLRRTLERIKKDGCVAFVAPAVHGGHAEGDDVIGSLCEWAEKQGHRVTIASGDKDVCQLASGSVLVLSLNKGELYDEEKITALHGVPPKMLPHLFALAGDTSDNYKLIDGVGPKRALDLLKCCGGDALALPSKLGSLRDVVGDALTNKIHAIEGLEQRLAKLLEVATIRRDLMIDFMPVEAEPVYSSPDEAEPPEHALAALTNPAPAMMTPKSGEMLQPVQSVQHQAVSLPYWANPGYLGALWDVSKAYVAARCFPNVGSPEQVMVVGMIAQEDGIGIATAMQHAYFVHGRLSWSATYLLMRAQASGQVERFQVQKCDDKICQIEAKRRGQPARVVVWEWSEAERAGLTKPSRNGEPSNWMKWPKEMNLARCIARALRQEFRELIGGRYVPEEMSEDLPDEAVLRSARETRAALEAAA